MAVYATAADLASLGLPAAALAAVSSDDQTAALADASSLIDSYLAPRFDLPLSAVPAQLKGICCKLAAFDVLRKRGFNPGSVDAETVRLSYEDAMRWLRDVAAGRATPAFPEAADVAGSDVQSLPFVYAPAPGSIGLSASAFRGRDTDADVEVGTVGAPRRRGW